MKIGLLTASLFTWKLNLQIRSDLGTEFGPNFHLTRYDHDMFNIPNNNLNLIKGEIKIFNLIANEETSMESEYNQPSD